MLTEKELATWIEETHGKKECGCIAAKYNQAADPFCMPQSSEYTFTSSSSYSVKCLSTDKTLDTVHLKMAEEDKKKADAGDGMMPNVSAGAFILLGTEIQVLQ